MTDEEKAEFGRLTSDAEAEAFVEIFWARRDPNQKTSFNEFKAEFEAKVAAADKQFSWTTGTGEQMPGSLSDRGKVLILMGVPGKPVENFPPSSDDARSELMQRGATQVWSFLKPTAKPGSTKDDDFITFTFIETRPDAKDYLFDKMERKNKASLKVLAERPKQLMVNKINSVAEIPRLLIDGTLAATTEQLAILDAEPKPWPEGAAALVVAGVGSETLHPIWLHLQLPNAVEVVDLAVGRATRKSDGKDDRNVPDPGGGHQSRGRTWLRAVAAGRGGRVQGGRGAAEGRDPGGGALVRCRLRPVLGGGDLPLCHVHGSIPARRRLSSWATPSTWAAGGSSRGRMESTSRPSSSPTSPM